MTDTSHQENPMNQTQTAPGHDGVPVSLLEAVRLWREVGPHPAPGEDTPTHSGPGDACQDPACVKARAQHEAVADIQDITVELFRENGDES